MHVLGIDPSSSCTGLAVVDVDSEELVAHAYWQPSKRVKKLAAKQKDGSPKNDIPRLAAYYSWLNSWMKFHKGLFDEVAVEDLGVTRGAGVARVLAHFQAASCLASHRNGLPVSQTKAGVARNILFGCPITVSKERAHALLHEHYDSVDFPGGPAALDIADAFVLGAARAKMLKN